MGKIIGLVLATLLLSGCLKPPTATALDAAATALGGKEKILALGTLTIEGEGTNASLGQNRTPDAPPPVWKVTGYSRTIDPGQGRMRLEQTRTAEFPFPLQTTIRDVQGIDRDVAWNVDEAGNAVRLTERAAVQRRVEMLHYPIAIVAAALDRNAKLSNYRQQGGLELLDVMTNMGDVVTLAIDKTTKLPSSVSSRTSHPQLGDVTIETSFSDYGVAGGLTLPKHMVTKIDKWVLADIRVSQNTVDAPVNLAAPEPLKAALPAEEHPPVSITATQVAPGIWWLAGDGNHHSVVFEFSDHLTVFELPLSEDRAKAVMERARSLSFRKLLTEVIVSHHHFNHSAGLRTAVAEGLTIITQRGNIALFRDLVGRSHMLAPDQLAMNPTAPPLMFNAVDDELVLKDNSMEVDLYHVKDNAHADTMLMAWVPRDRILVQADLYDSGWLQFPWADNLRENLALRKLNPEKDVPIHGKIENYADVLKAMSVKK